MADLKDIAPSFKTVKTSFGDLTVRGISLQGIVQLMTDHPKIWEAIAAPNKSFATIAGLGLDVVAGFMAAGLGYPGDTEAIQRCKEMNPDDSLLIGEAIIEKSFPHGVEDFFEKLPRLIPGFPSLKGILQEMRASANQAVESALSAKV